MSSEDATPTATPKPDRRVIKDAKGRGLAVALGVGLVVMGFVVFAILQMGGEVANKGAASIIVAKEFRPRAETQITVGTSGLQKERIEGSYVFRVRVPSVGDREYFVWVEKEEFDTHDVGDDYYIVRQADREHIFIELQKPPETGSADDNP